MEFKHLVPYRFETFWGTETRYSCKKNLSGCYRNCDDCALIRFLFGLEEDFAWMKGIITSCENMSKNLKKDFCEDIDMAHKEWLKEHDL